MHLYSRASTVITAAAAYTPVALRREASSPLVESIEFRVFVRNTRNGKILATVGELLPQGPKCGYGGFSVEAFLVGYFGQCFESFYYHRCVPDFLAGTCRFFRFMRAVFVAFIHVCLGPRESSGGHFRFIPDDTP